MAKKRKKKSGAAPSPSPTARPAEATEVAIVGGGIAGLAAAYALSKKGIDFRLLEADSRFGGVIRTEHVDDFVLEAGPDTILAQKPEGVALCRELGLGDRLVPTNPRERRVFVLRRGRLRALPAGMVLAVPTRILPFALSRLFSWPAKLRMGMDLFIPSRKQDGDESIASFLLRRLGHEALELLGEPLLAGIHAGDPEQLSMSATFPRFVEMERRHGSLIRAMWAARARSRKAGPAPTMFYALSGGLQELVDTLVPRLPAEKLRTGTRVTRVTREGTGFRLESSDGAVFTARAAILAAPAPRAAPLVEGLDSEVGDGLASIPFASSATVLLAYRREDVAHPLNGYGLVVPRTEGLCTLAVSFLSTKFPGRAPEGFVLLRGFLGGTRDPDVIALADRSLVHTVETEMRVPLGLEGEPVLTRVYRWPETTPQMTVGHAARLAHLEERLATLPGLFLTGAGLRGTGIPDTVADGTRAAEAAEAYLGGDGCRADPDGDPAR